MLTTHPELTARQQEIWQYLVQYVDDHGYPPTVREIGDAVGLASPSTVHAHLANLERTGLLKRDPTKPRAIELTGQTAARAHCDARARASGLAAPRPHRRRRSAARGGDDRGDDRGARAARSQRRLPPPCHRRLDGRGRNPRRRRRRRPQAGRRTRWRRRRRARRRRRDGRRGDREDVPPRVRAVSACSPRTARSSLLYPEHVQILGKVDRRLPDPRDERRTAQPDARPGARPRSCVE